VVLDVTFTVPWYTVHVTFMMELLLLLHDGRQLANSATWVVGFTD
jgi:hypothetical protein